MSFRIQNAFPSMAAFNRNQRPVIGKTPASYSFQKFRQPQWRRFANGRELKFNENMVHVLRADKHRDVKAPFRSGNPQKTFTIEGIYREFIGIPDST